MEMTCQNCIHGYKDEAAGNGGVICKRYPPRPIMVPIRNALSNEAGMAIQSFFPTMGAEDTCGEFHPQQDKAS